MILRVRAHLLAQFLLLRYTLLRRCYSTFIELSHQHTVCTIYKDALSLYSCHHNYPLVAAAFRSITRTLKPKRNLFIEMYIRLIISNLHMCNFAYVYTTAFITTKQLFVNSSVNNILMMKLW